MSFQKSNLFNFPFKPYSIQVDLMKKIYQVLEEKKIGVLSSPTGSGKSLSIICSSFYFLQKLYEDDEKLVLEKIKQLNENLNQLELTSNSLSLNWVELHSKKQKINDELLKMNELAQNYQKINERSKEFKLKNQKIAKPIKSWNQINQIKTKKKFKKDEIENDDESSNNLDQNLITFGEDNEDEGSDQDYKIDQKSQVSFKILYCSRTHSQLSQFVNEVKKTVYADSIRLLPLGSRSNLCINPSINKQNSVHLINEKCLEMQKISKKCPFLKQNVLEDVRDILLAQVHDIEEAYSVGCSLKGCSYYSSRLAVPEAHVLAVPYNIIFHKSTRESFGIFLKDSIVIIDEAHNLIEAIASIHSAQITGGQLLDCLTQLNQYLIKYNTRLNPNNLMNLKQLSFVISSLIKLIKLKLNHNQTHLLYTPAEFTISAEIDNFNLFKIIEFCEKSKIARKLLGFSKLSDDHFLEKQKLASVSGTAAFLAKLKSQKMAELKKKPIKKKVETIASTSSSTDVDSNSNSSSSLYPIIEFLRCLTNPTSDGRILLVVDSFNSRKSVLKFLLLNPANQFKDIIEESRSVILIGGTMEPFSEFIDHLFKPNGVENEKIICFSCDHIIPKENLLPICISKDSSGKILFDFTFKSRFNPKLFEAVGNLLLQLCSLIPGGIIVFFPSYEYEKLVYGAWLKSGLIEKFEKAGKKVFSEPKKASQVTEVLLNYSKTIDTFRKKIDSKAGAILLSVVGGKMSEGINFSDDLGRCVMMIGLPYPNLNSPELKEKMSYLSKLRSGLDEEYYENLCIKAVNQSIGRVIRHKSDFAAIILVDQRYCNKISIQNNLPTWIGKHLQVHQDQFTACYQIKQFFDKIR